MSALTAGIKRSVSLETLGLRSCCIGNAGAGAIASVLPFCRTLNSLDVARNDITEEAKTALEAVAIARTADKLMPSTQALRRGWRYM